MTTVLGLRTCNADMTSYNGFIWPKSGRATCPDWNPEPICGYGLHFLPWGVGDSALLNWYSDAVWLVVSVDSYSVVNIDNKKSKCPECKVVYCGDRQGATQYIYHNGGAGKPIVGLVYIDTKDSSTLTGGDMSTLTGGYGSTLTGGDMSTLTGGDRSTLTGGDRSNLVFKWWNDNHYRLVVGFVGEGGIQPGVAYKLNDNHEIIEA